LPGWQQVGGNGDPARYQADMHRKVRDKEGFAESQFGWYRRIIVPVPSIVKGQVFLFYGNPAPQALNKGKEKHI
jgi:hypothetical protein